MTAETIDQLIDEAHRFFDKTSIFEVIDSEEWQAREFLNNHYNNPEPERIEAYLTLVKRVRLML